MAVQACLNGGRTRDQHPAVPLTPSELAADAIAVRAAGAFAVHVHPRDVGGLETMQARSCDAAVGALRAAVPRIPIGVSTAETIDPDPFARASAIGSWRQAPDFVSVNVRELGWAGIVRAALAGGIGVEAGLGSPADAEEFAHSPFVHRVLRALVEVDGGAAQARATAQLIPDGVSQLWHGFDGLTWEVLSAGAAAGADVRIGLEDTLVLHDGRVATDNAELVAAAVELTGARP